MKNSKRSPMSRDQVLAQRVRAALGRLPRVAERQMFGGICFMVNGKMCITVGHGRLMCRIDPEQHEAAVARKGARTVRMKGRAYRGFVHVREDAVRTQRALHYWVGLCLAFNGRAKSSRKRTPARRRITR